MRFLKEKLFLLKNYFKLMTKLSIIRTPIGLPASHLGH